MSNPFTILQKTPCGTCHSECCHNVPMHRIEIEKIVKWINEEMDDEYAEKLSQQKRPEGMCLFVDVEKWKCSIYPARPLICRLFGYAENLACSYAPALAKTHTKGEAFLMFAKEFAGCDPEDITLAGHLFTWDNIEFKEKEVK